jgi:hypothetical protein
MPCQGWNENAGSAGRRCSSRLLPVVTLEVRARKRLVVMGQFSAYEVLAIVSGMR